MESTRYADIFQYIKAQETAFNLPIRMNDTWEWGFKEHVKLSVLYKNTQFEQGNSKQERNFKPFKNITRPILNLQYRAEGFDVKDITLYVDEAANYYKSFLIKKFHEKWARDNALDTFIDEMVESYVDFGGALVKNVNDVKPEVVPLQSIAFCDQTDMLSGPIGIKHFFSPDQLMEMEKNGWGQRSNGATTSLKEAIALSRSEKREAHDTTTSFTPGKYIEVYEVHGQFPKSFLKETASTEEYENQLHIVCFYQQRGEKQGVTLFKGKENKSPFKLIKRDPVHGRALGFGGAEELFEPQVWINYDMLRIQDMKDAASKIILKSTDPNFGNKNNLKDMENLQVVELTVGTDLAQVDTFPRNIKLFEQSEISWEAHAQQMGAANDAIMGESPSAGTPFRLQELVTQEAHSLHEYRKGKLATFLDEIYRDWVIPRIQREITKGQEFLAELDIEELNYVADALVNCQANELIKEKILNGELIDPSEVEGYKEIVRGDFKKRGNKHFLKIFKDEMKSAPLSVKTNIAGKQKYLGQAVDKIVNVIRFVISSGGPTTLAAPGVWNLINQVIEQSGLNPVDFSSLADEFKKLQQQQAQAAQQTQPILPTKEPAYA